MKLGSDAAVRNKKYSALVKQQGTPKTGRFNFATTRSNLKVRVGKADTAYWCDVRDQNGRRLAIKLGSCKTLDFKEAARLSEDKVAEVKGGGLLGQESVPAAFAAFTKVHGSGRGKGALRAPEKLEACWRNHIGFRLDMPLAKVTPTLLHAALEDIREKQGYENSNASGGNESARISLHYLAAFFGWCQRTGRVGSNPMATVMLEDTAIVKAPPRERVLTLEEVRTLLDTVNASNVSETVAIYYALLVLLGCRSGELIKCRWGDILSDRIRVPKAHNKTGTGYDIPTKSVKAQIDRLRELNFDSGLLLGGLSEKAPAKALARLQTPTKTKPARLQLGVTCRDLRRTHATLLASECGAPVHIVKAVLAHSVGGVTGVYLKSDYFPEREEVQAALAAKIAIV